MNEEKERQFQQENELFIRQIDISNQRMRVLNSVVKYITFFFILTLFLGPFIEIRSSINSELPSISKHSLDQRIQSLLQVTSSIFATQSQLIHFLHGLADETYFMGCQDEQIYPFITFALNTQALNQPRPLSFTLLVNDSLCRIEFSGKNHSYILLLSSNTTTEFKQTLCFDQSTNFINFNRNHSGYICGRPFAEYTEYINTNTSYNLTGGFAGDSPPLFKLTSTENASISMIEIPIKNVMEIINSTISLNDFTFTFFSEDEILMESHPNNFTPSLYAPTDTPFQLNQDSEVYLAKTVQFNPEISLFCTLRITPMLRDTRFFTSASTCLFSALASLAIIVLLHFKAKNEAELLTKIQKQIVNPDRQFDIPSDIDGPIMYAITSVRRLQLILPDDSKLNETLDQAVTLMTSNENNRFKADTHNCLYCSAFVTKSYEIIEGTITNSMQMLLDYLIDDFDPITINLFDTESRKHLFQMNCYIIKRFDLVIDGLDLISVFQFLFEIASHLSVDPFRNMRILSVFIKLLEKGLLGTLFDRSHALLTLLVLNCLTVKIEPDRPMDKISQRDEEIEMIDSLLEETVGCAEVAGYLTETLRKSRGLEALYTLGMAKIRMQSPEIDTTRNADDAVLFISAVVIFCELYEALPKNDGGFASGFAEFASDGKDAIPEQILNRIVEYILEVFRQMRCFDMKETDDLSELSEFS